MFNYFRGDAAFVPQRDFSVTVGDLTELGGPVKLVSRLRRHHHRRCRRDEILEVAHAFATIQAVLP